jgi:hypothetical protein
LALHPRVEAIFLKHAQARSKSAESARQLNKQTKSLRVADFIFRCLLVVIRDICTKSAASQGEYSAKAGLTTTTNWRLIVMAVRSLSPKQILERTQQHRQAVMLFAQLAAKRAVQDEMRAQCVRVTLVPHAEVMRQAREYLDTHPELYQQALERAKRMGYVDPRADIKTGAQKQNEPKSITSVVHISGAK